MTTKDNDTTQEHKKSLTLELSAKTRKRLDGLDEAGGAPQRSKTVTVEVKRSRRFRSPQASGNALFGFVDGLQRTGKRLKLL